MWVDKFGVSLLWSFLAVLTGYGNINDKNSLITVKGTWLQNDNTMQTIEIAAGNKMITVDHFGNTGCGRNTSHII